MKLYLFISFCFIGLETVSLSRMQTVPHRYHLIMTPMTWPTAQNYCRTVYTELAAVISSDDWVRANMEIRKYVPATTNIWFGLYNDINSWHWSLNNVPLKNYIIWGNLEPNNALGKESCVIIMTNGYWGDRACTELRPFICYNDQYSGAARFIGISSLVTWPAAQAYCRTYHTDLASSLSSSDNNMIMQVRNIQGDSWFGLYRDTWKWTDETNASNLPWSAGQPDNWGGNDNCAGLYNGKLFDASCLRQLYFLCHTIPPVWEQQIVRLQVKSDSSVFDPVVQSSILYQIKLKLKEKGVLENIKVTWRVQQDGNIFHKKKKDEL